MKRILTLSALVFATSCFGQETCPNMYDGNGNGTIDIEDFLGILGLFGDVDVDSDGLWDSQDYCTDTGACNFEDHSAESCTYPDALGDCEGDCPADEDGDGICDIFSCGGPLLYQGHTYLTVAIGDQCWFAENLRNEFYRHGDQIPPALSDGDWGTTLSGAVSIYGEDEGCESFSPLIETCNSVESLEEFGRLYNWFAAVDPRGLCPTGWHTPDEEEWDELSQEVGGYSNAGNALKADVGWYLEGNGSDEFGFSGLPAGDRRESGWFSGGGRSTRFWTSTLNEPYARSRGFNWIQDDITGGNWPPNTGMSVRCIKDSE